MWPTSLAGMIGWSETLLSSAVVRLYFLIKDYMRKWYHFIEKPDMPIPTRAERLQEREATARDLRFMAVYGFCFILMFLLVTIASVLTSDKSEPDTIEKVHAEICQSVPNSPLCSDFPLLERIDTIARNKSVPTRLLVGIAFAESTIGTNFNKPACKATHNWSGLKGKMDDAGDVVMYSLNRRKPDSEGCWLYRFKSVEDSFYSLANTISIGYRTCEHRTECIAYAFVGDPDVAEASWIARVEKFYRPL